MVENQYRYCSYYRISEDPVLEAFPSELNNVVIYNIKTIVLETSDWTFFEISEAKRLEDPNCMKGDFLFTTRGRNESFSNVLGAILSIMEASSIPRSSMESDLVLTAIYTKIKELDIDASNIAGQIDVYGFSRYTTIQISGNDIKMISYSRFRSERYRIPLSDPGLMDKIIRIIKLEEATGKD